MSEPFLGEIRLFPFGQIPQGWMACNGQILAISQNQALFSLLSTTYGGNGTTTFALPNLQGRVPVHVSYGMGSVTWGQTAGEVTHTLNISEMPAHTHVVAATSATATEVNPENMVWAAQESTYGTTLNTQLSSAALSNAGGSEPHANMQPYLVLNYCIAVTGIYPSRN